MKTKAASPSVLAVAYSGGRDSTALLHCALQAAAPAGLQVLALHVHHGLQPDADAWLEHCRRECAAWARKAWPVEFHAAQLGLRPGKGESVEAVARKARYQALREMALAHGADSVLLAHHRRDQAETFLLQALRGGGVTGLAAMPRAIEREGLTWLRPWLDHPREDIEAYVRHHRLRYIDDGSNADPRYARNRLRIAVWPALEGAFPQAEATLAEAAQWAQDASACLDELATQDLAHAVETKGLRLRALEGLSPARARNALRAWYRQAAGQGMPASLLARLWDELPERKTGQWESSAGELRLYRGVLSLQRATSPGPSEKTRETTLGIRRAGAYRLPGWGGVLHATRVSEGGVLLSRLAQVRLKEREGGERFQMGVGRPLRSLKKQFQSAAIAAWEREGPLAYDGEALLFVPGLGIDARVQAAAGEPQVSLRWEPDTSR